MNKFVPTPPNTPLFSWSKMEQTKGVYMWAGMEKNDKQSALFVSNGLGTVMVVYQNYNPSTSNNIQFALAPKTSWGSSTFIRMSGTLTCEFVS